MTDHSEHPKCEPCEGISNPLTTTRTELMMKEISGWVLASDYKSIEKIFEFSNFLEAVAFINSVAELAELQGHHPDIELFAYKKVRLTLSTHAVKGLSNNDFILASKINEMLLLD